MDIASDWSRVGPCKWPWAVPCCRQTADGIAQRPLSIRTSCCTNPTFNGAVEWGEDQHYFSIVWHWLVYHDLRCNRMSGVNYCSRSGRPWQCRDTCKQKPFPSGSICCAICLSYIYIGCQRRTSCFLAGGCVTRMSFCVCTHNLSEIQLPISYQPHVNTGCLEEMVSGSAILLDICD